MKLESYIDLRSVDQSMYNESTGAGGEPVEDTVYRVYYTCHNVAITRVESKPTTGVIWSDDCLTRKMRFVAYELIAQAHADEDSQAMASSDGEDLTPWIANGIG